MKKKIIGCLFIGVLAILNVSAQETFKVMFYNLLNYPVEDAVPNREDDLEFILNDYQPDLFLVCELNNILGATNVLGITRTAISSNFNMATYVSNTSDDNGSNQNDLQNLLYYDSSKFILEEEIIVPTDLRDFNVYKLKVNSVNQNTNPVQFYVVVCHLKASNGEDNINRRFSMILALDAYLDTLPEDSNVLLGGDLNLYTASEPAYQFLEQSSNNVAFLDPANRVGSWSNNSNFVDVFTQSTRTQSGLGGTAGGFDDRFDFIMLSDNMFGSADMNYVPDSYVVYGNNGLSSCYNRAINSSNCGNTGSPFSFAIRDALHNFSDHLPVTLTLQTEASLLSTLEVDMASKILKDNVVQSVLTLYNEDLKLTNKSVVLYNNLGQKMKTFIMGYNSQEHLDVSDLPNGIYYINMEGINASGLKFIISN